METSVPGGNKNCFSGRSCSLSRRRRDHSVDQRFPSHSPVTISEQVSRSSVSSP
jgi:hypothetical protein